MFESNALEYVYIYMYIEEKCTYKNIEEQIFDFNSKFLHWIFLFSERKVCLKSKIFFSMPT